MKLSAIGQTQRDTLQYQNNKQNGTTFKSGAFLNVIGNSMAGIENQGYFLSFLIQDGLGMTLPRTLTGFHRDKDITGKYNFQEGFEVLGREGLTGPFIIAVAPAVLAITGLFCKSTNTNTRLIKRFGESMKSMLKEPSFDKAALKDKARLKKEFYRYNIESIYKNTVPNDAKSEETVNKILAEFEKFDSKNKKERKEALSNIENIINEKMMENSSDLYNVNTLSVGKGNTKKAFGLKETLTALKDFGNDAITNNANAESLDEKAVENIKNNFAAKRLLTNIANIAITLGGLAVLPKLYIRSDVAPGAKTQQALQEAKEQQSETVEIENASNPVFKGKGINSDGIFSKTGKFITKYVPEKVHELLEYTGFNFTPTTFASLSLFGLLLPRGKKAWDRAQIDENGKRDMTEINEILLRDTVSSLSVVFAVPLLTKALVKSYENKLGFILTNRASDGKNAFKKALDIINPYSDLHVLSLGDLDRIYGNIDSKAKLLNFADFVDKKGGDLEKILSQSSNSAEIFNDKTFTLESIRGLSKKEKNQRIIEVFKNIPAEDKLAKNESIQKLMMSTGKIKDNKILRMARGLNSLPGFISLVLISPVLLGVFIPMLTYHNTKKAYEKKNIQQTA